MGRFSPGFVGHYAKPNYLADALNGVADTVGELLRDRRTADARTADRLSQQSFSREMHDSDQMHADIRTAELDGRYRDEQRRADKRNKLDLALQGIVETGSAQTSAPVIGLGGELVRPATAYTPLGDSGYSQEASRTPQGMQAEADRKNRAQVGEIAGLVPDQSLAARIRGLSNPTLAASVAGPSITGPAEDARKLNLFRQQQAIEHSYDRPGDRAPIMIGGLPYSFANGQVTPVTLPNGQAPTISPKARQLPSSIVSQLSDLNAASQALDDVIGAKDFDQSFGIGNRFLPDFALNLVSPKHTGTRASLAAASATVRHALSGAAVTPSEMKNLEPFIPGNGETPASIRAKIGELKKYLARKAAGLRSGGAIPVPGADTDTIDPDILDALGGH